MEKSSYFVEIFGFEELAEGVSSVPMSLPTDDQLWAHLPGGTKADAAIGCLLDDGFVSELAGMTPAEFRKAVSAPVPLADTASRIESLLAKGELCPDFDGLMKTAARGADGSLQEARWHSAITGIVENARRHPALARIRDSDGWQRLKDSSVEYVQRCLECD